MNSINIEEIMEEIREKIKNREYGNEPLSFEEIEMSEYADQNINGYNQEEFQRDLDFLNRNRGIPVNVPILAADPISSFIKKAIRKLTRFIIYPIVEFQNAYNASLLRCMHQVNEYIKELELYKEKIDKMEKEIEELKKNQIGE